MERLRAATQVMYSTYHQGRYLRKAIANLWVSKVDAGYLFYLFRLQLLGAAPCCELWQPWIVESSADVESILPW